MSQTPKQVADAILATLAQTAPGLSCAVGTPERKIIDACAQTIAAAYISQYLTGGMLDINTNSGLELEQFVGIFGFGRLQGQPARGTVTLTVTTPAVTDMPVKLGTQFYTTTGLAGQTSTLYYASTQAVVLPAQSYSVSVPVQCTSVGSNGNVPPDSITSQAAALGAATVTNLTAMTGGVDVETDAALRQRFMDTLLRNISGTEDWYLNVAFQNKNINRAAVYGPAHLFATQVKVQSSTTVLPSLSDVKYVWPGMTSCFKNLGQANETFYAEGEARDYTLTWPNFNRINTGTLVVNDIVDLEFQYTPTCSRNDPVNGITNKIDVFIDGTTPFNVTETTTILENPKLGAPGHPELATANFVRVGEVATGATANNRFTRLGSVPVIAFPSTLTVGTTVYTRGTHYHLLQGTTLNRGSRLEVAGIEWESTGPASGTQLVLNYTYNQTPEILDAVYGASKQIGTDVLTHQADYQYIVVCLTVEYDRTYSIPAVDAAITSRLQLYFQNLGFGASIKLSNLGSAVQQVLGVVDVHVTTSAEATAVGVGTPYGLRMYDNEGDTAMVGGAPQTADFKLLDNQLAIYSDKIILRAPTT